MHQTEGRPQVVQDSSTLSKSDEGFNLSSHIPANQIPPVSGPMVPASGQNPARMFHPNRPGCLHVGHRRSDRTVVWLSTPPRPPTFQQVFRDHNLAKASERKLDFDWLEEFKVERFPGPSAARKEKARRLHLNDIICANRDIATPDQSHALEDQTSLAEDTSDDGTDGHGSIDETEMTPELLTGTRLVVSTNDRSNFASFYVYVSLSCRTCSNHLSKIAETTVRLWRLPLR